MNVSGRIWAAFGSYLRYLEVSHEVLGVSGLICVYVFFGGGLDNAER